MASLRPIIAICGTTGVGKSKLAVELALRITEGAVVINADAMQVYEGLDIITNKLPSEEMMGIPHLLMGYKKPGEQYVVGQWVEEAARAIDGIHDQNKIPIVVGGTSYWIQHLIFPDRLIGKGSGSPSTSRPSEDLLSKLTSEERDLFEKLPDSPQSASTDPDGALAMYKLLQTLDPTVAARWHWRDTRKVSRSLKIIAETGRLPSDIIAEQSETDLTARYRTLFFWLYAEPDALNPRLDQRVDQMLQQGLLEEVRLLKGLKSPIEQTEGDEKDVVDYTLGIYQSIGYREFDRYVELQNTGESQTAYELAVQSMKQSTRRYAKRQVSWIKNKLIPAVLRVNEGSVVGQTTAIYVLDATEVNDSWDDNVLRVADKITRDFLDKRSLPNPVELSPAAKTQLVVPEKPLRPSDALARRRKIVCPVCSLDPDRPVMIEEGEQWESHQRTRSHQRLARRRSDRQESPELP
ncbi:tRNA isopentenyltransferase [Thelephora terrestris]|uniref:tRNA dimethylallyltransferase n=1 Tax=Thelephora terrestris TaxID=56493 RepID=A0A9P6LC11_9AGAM|nr:tRNA isopentenyltransferase [Thelephora terrestris]